MLPVIIIVAAVAIIAIFFLLNNKGASQEKEGFVKEVLNKTAFVVEFEDQKPTVVKLHGITPASENEMLDDKIFEYLYENVRGKRVKVKPIRVETGDVIVGGIYLLSGEYVNAIMAQQGFARWSPSEAADDQAIAQAQEKAKSQQAGVWNPAVRQLMEEKMRKIAAGELDDEDVSNMSVNPDDYETKESKED